MIELKNISFVYEQRQILTDISLKISEGESVALLGHNGSGKTTLIKHLNGLLMPSKGEVIVDGLSTKKNDWEIKKKVGFVFQSPEDQLINSIVEEDIAFGLENLGVAPIEMRKRVDAILNALEISTLAKENVNNLSFGQKQLVALAGVLVMEPKYVVFDEPSSMLDPKNKANLRKIISNLIKGGTTVLLVTQNLEDILGFKRIIILDQGRIVFDGKKLSRAVLKKSGLYG
ncbi:MAG TPA: ATP-binding cassette domain-containing protein [Candidatus Nanoarchaeia archaeon]|nr:ATP-binding cassette domain-containing protein [Candidatus Nanoarchaeia archaeon]